MIRKCLVAFLAFFLSQGLFAASNSSSTLIKIGMTVPLSGEMKPVGNGVKEGIEIYFSKINATNGIPGYKLQLIALDDQYDPLLAGKNVRFLITTEKVFAMMGNMGSAPATVTLPIINANKMLLFAPITGNSIYRQQPPDRYVFNFRASLDEEAAALVHAALKMGTKASEFAFFTQNDSFGDAVYRGAINALKAAGADNPESLPYGRFIRSTSNVENALATILENTKSPPKVFILGGNFDSNGKFIKLAKKIFPDALFFGVSGRISPEDFSEATEKNIFSTELVPDINSDLPGIQEYRADLKKYGKNITPDFNNLEGYLSAKVFVLALQKAAKENKLSREEIISVLENFHDVDIGIGEKISFDKINHQALHRVWIMTIKKGKLIPFK